MLSTCIKYRLLSCSRSSSVLSISARAHRAPIQKIIEYSITETYLDQHIITNSSTIIMFIKSIVLCSLLCLSSPAIATYGSVVSSIQTLAGIVAEDDQDVNDIESVSGVLAAQVDLRSFAQSSYKETHTLCAENRR